SRGARVGLRLRIGARLGRRPALVRGLAVHRAVAVDLVDARAGVRRAAPSAGAARSLGAGVTAAGGEGENEEGCCRGPSSESSHRANLRTKLRRISAAYGASVARAYIASELPPSASMRCARARR